VILEVLGYMALAYLFIMIVLFVVGFINGYRLFNRYNNLENNRNKEK
jgi:hypothetical protein